MTYPDDIAYLRSQYRYYRKKRDEAHADYQQAKAFAAAEGWPIKRFAKSAHDRWCEAVEDALWAKDELQHANAMQRQWQHEPPWACWVRLSAWARWQVTHTRMLTGGAV